jgi:ParB family chromosome partitioning protein
MQAVSISARVSGKAPALPGTRAEFRLGDLVPTAHNVRKTKRTPETIRAMAQSIFAHGGVMQNLLLVADIKDGKWTGKYGVAGGETRRLGCCHLRDGGIPEAAAAYTDDFLLPGLIVDAPEASAISATENIQRTQLHPADEFEAFRELYDQCGSSEHVAEFFAVSPATVERRLKLANASPKLFSLFRDGQMNLDQLMALCLVDDHERQESVWNAGKSNPWMRNASNLRQALTVGKLNVRDSRVARFVGTIDYQAAGGVVVKDLFSQHADDGYIEDGALLQRLAAEKLEAAATAVRAEGWTWVEVKLDFKHEEQSRYGRAPSRTRPLSPSDAKLLADLRKQTEVARKAWRAAEESEAAEDEVARLDAVADELHAQVKALADSATSVQAAYKPISGAVVTISHSGGVEVYRGFVRPEDRKELKRLQKAQARGTDASGTSGANGRANAQAPAAPGQELSRPFKLRLAAQRTAAMQVTLARNIPLALASLAFALVSDVIVDDRHSRTLRVSCKSARARLDSLDPSVESSSAFMAMGALLATWRARMPEKDLFAWLCALPQEELLQLIALCTALTLDSVSEHVFEAAPLEGHAAAIARRAALDMADWWSPTSASYFDHVSKANTLATVTQTVSVQAAAPLAVLKKAELGVHAEKLLAGKRWLPALLLTQG